MNLGIDCLFSFSHSLLFVDGRLFGFLLEYLRTGKWRVPTNIDPQDVLDEAKFYSIDLHVFAPLSDAALQDWMEAKTAASTSKQWLKYPELEEIKQKVIQAFRYEQLHGEGHFQFVFYPEIESESGSISRFLSKLIAEDDVSPEHRKVIEHCKGQLMKCDFTHHPYYAIPLPLWKILGLPQCQTLLIQRLSLDCKLTVDFKLSRIGIARVEKRQDAEGGGSFYMVHDFYALNGFSPNTSSSWQQETQPGSSSTLRQQFDRCISALLCVWSFKPTNVKSPKMSHRGDDVASPSN